MSMAYSDVVWLYVNLMRKNVIITLFFKMVCNIKLVAFKFNVFELLAIATDFFIASFWLCNQVKARAVVMPFVIKLF